MLNINNILKLNPIAHMLEHRTLSHLLSQKLCWRFKIIMALNRFPTVQCELTIHHIAMDYHSLYSSTMTRILQPLPFHSALHSFFLHMSCLYINVSSLCSSILNGASLSLVSDMYLHLRCGYCVFVLFPSFCCPYMMATIVFPQMLLKIYTRSSNHYHL